MKLLACSAVVFLSATFCDPAPAVAANWPGWRGGDGQGISADTQLPVAWSETNNVRWRVELPGPGNASPIVWGDRVFVAQAVKAENRRTLMCFDRATGKRLWQSGVTYAESEPTQQSNPYCTATPVTDGERVVVSFGSAGLFCYDFAGQEVWHRDFGKLTHMFGNASSPVLQGDLCFLNFGPDAQTRLIAVNKKTGASRWEAEPPKPGPEEQPAFGGRGGPGGPGGPGGSPPGEGPGGGGRGGRGRGMGGASWSTPVVVQAGARAELVVAFPNRLVAYEPATGKQLWFSKGLGGTIYTTPLWADGAVIAMSGGPGGGSAISVKSGGAGDVTESQRVWRQEKIKGRIGSGVVHGGHAYFINDNGVAECADLKTGETVWSERLPAKGAKSGSWSSLLLANGNLYAPNQSGDVTVFKAAPKFEVVGVNSIGGEPTNASLAASDGELFLRTDQALWCLGAKPAP